MVLGEYLDILLPFNAPTQPNSDRWPVPVPVLSINNSIDLFRVEFREEEGESI
jgi:hypothetical protein